MCSSTIHTLALSPALITSEDGAASDLCNVTAYLRRTRRRRARRSVEAAARTCDPSDAKASAAAMMKLLIFCVVECVVSLPKTSNFKVAANKYALTSSFYGRNDTVRAEQLIQER